MERVGVRVPYAYPTMPLTLFTLLDTIGSCSMLPRDKQGVVDSKLKVHIIKGCCKLPLTPFSRCMVLPTFASRIYPSFRFRSLHTLNVCAPASFALHVRMLTCSSCRSYRICDWRERHVWFSFRSRLSTYIFNCSSR
jgi:hypothetical protein